jgi:hypothetical protein
VVAKLWLIAACAPLGALAADAAGPQAEPWLPGEAHAVAAPHHGDVLFHLYQGDIGTALSTLMVSQHFQRLGPHADEDELLRGGLLLGWGLHDEAARVFARLIDRNAAPAVRDRAWFLLAQARQQRGLLDAAQAALDRIQAPLPGELQTERLLLQAQLMLVRRDFAAAARVLGGVQGDGTAARYARYNLAVALVQGADTSAPPGLPSGDRARGLALLDSLGQQPAVDEEQHALRDRANLALGYARLQASQPREARAALQRVRLSGPLSNKALLGHGWAALGLNEPQQALVSWAELAARPEGDAAVLEARLAVPYAQGEMRAHATALQGYQQAALSYGREQQALTETLARVRGVPWVEQLLAPKPDPSASPEASVTTTSGRASAGPAPALAGLDAPRPFDGIAQVRATPHSAHLLPLLASAPFHAGLKNLHDLQAMEQQVRRQLDQLGAFEDMLDNRRSAFAERLPRALAQQGAAAIAALQARRDALTAELAQAQAAADGRAYASPREQQLQDRIVRSQGTLDRLAQLAAVPGTGLDESLALDITATRDRLRRAEAALSWQLAEQFTDRAWTARKALRDADAALAEARRREAALSQALLTEPAKQAAFAARIAQQRARLLAVLPPLQALAGEQRAELQAQAVAELQQQQARLVVYAAQAELAIAQVQDSAQFARQADPVPIPPGRKSEVRP